MALNNLKRVDMPLNKETKPNQTKKLYRVKRSGDYKGYCACTNQYFTKTADQKLSRIGTDSSKLCLDMYRRLAIITSLFPWFSLVVEALILVVCLWAGIVWCCPSLSRSTTGLNSEFTFSYIGCPTKKNEPSLLKSWPCVTFCSLHLISKNIIIIIIIIKSC